MLATSDDRRHAIWIRPVEGSADEQSIQETYKRNRSADAGYCDYSPLSFQVVSGYPAVVWHTTTNTDRDMEKIEALIAVDGIPVAVTLRNDDGLTSSDHRVMRAFLRSIRFRNLGALRVAQEEM